MSRLRAQNDGRVTENLYRQYKQITLKHLKKRGLFKEAIGEVLFAMHVVSAEVFQVLVKVGSGMEARGNLKRKKRRAHLSRKGERVLFTQNPRATSRNG